MKKIPGDIILKGYVYNYDTRKHEYHETYFTEQEREVAVQVAQKWNERGCSPCLYHRTYNGKFTILYGKFIIEKPKTVKKPAKKPTKKTVKKIA